MGENRPAARHHGPRRVLRGLTAAAVMVVSSLAAVVLTESAANAACYSANACIGPGTTASMPNFVGYLDSSNEELGVAKLSNGAWGLCIDTGASYPWPSGTLTSTSKTDTDVAYAMSTYIPVIKSLLAAGGATNLHNAAEWAAALWWAVGADLGGGLNSQQAALTARVTTLQSEDAPTYNTISHLHDLIVSTATDFQGPYYGDKMVINHGTDLHGTVDNIGVYENNPVTHAQNWVPGMTATVTLTGATFDATGTNVASFSTGQALTGVFPYNEGTGTASSAAITATSPGVAISASMTVSPAPGSTYLLYRDNNYPSTQRVPARGPDTTVRSAAAAPAGLFVAAPVPLVVTKITDQNALAAPAGLVGVTIDVHDGDASGGVIASHTITGADIDASGHASVTFPPNFTPGNTYTVTLSNEPSGWRPLFGTLVATFNPSTNQYEVGFEDFKVWNPALVTTLSTDAPGMPAGTPIAETAGKVGDKIYDMVAASGTGGHAITGHYRLLGPVVPAGTVCPTTGDPAWASASVQQQGNFTITGDGTYHVGDFTIPKVGCYTYVESLPQTFTTTALPETAPGDVAETVLITTDAAMVTTLSSASTPGADGNPGPMQAGTVGASIFDSVAVVNTLGQTFAGHYKILGPVAALDSTSAVNNGGGTCPGQADAAWSAAPVAAEGDFAIDKGDGTYHVGDYTITIPGCYTYVDSAAGGNGVSPIPAAPAGIPSETTLIHAVPALVTRAGAAEKAVSPISKAGKSAPPSVKIGTTIADVVRVTGSQGKAVRGQWRLLGPAKPVGNKGCASLTAADWAMQDVIAHGSFTVTKGDGDYKVGAFKIPQDGCYAYSERLLASSVTDAVDWAQPGLVTETVLSKTVIPAVISVPAGGHSDGLLGGPVGWGLIGGLGSLCGAGAFALRRRRSA